MLPAKASMAAPSVLVAVTERVSRLTSSAGGGGARRLRQAGLRADRLGPCAVRETSEVPRREGDTKGRGQHGDIRDLTGRGGWLADGWLARNRSGAARETQVKRNVKTFDLEQMRNYHRSGLKEFQA